jgi:hypothetical protein
MTYSDTITLMMTFFILLLTFATSEPERFEQMKIAVFGSSGATGLAGKKLQGLEKNSWVMRIRPESGRMTDRGAEFPPVERDGDEEMVREGLAGLEEDEKRQIVNYVSVTIPGRSLGTIDGDLYDYGQHNMRLLAGVIRARPCQITFEGRGDHQVKRMLACAGFLTSELGVPLGLVAVSHDEFPDLDAEDVRIVLRRQNDVHHVQTQAPAAEQGE